MPGRHAHPVPHQAKNAVQLLLEPGRLGHPELERRQRRVDHPVEDQRAQVGGEQVRVRRTQERPIGHAHEREALVADRLAQLLEVAGDVGGPDEPEQWPRGARTRLRVPAVGGDQRVACGRGHRDGIGGRAVRGRRFAAAAVQATAVADAAWIHLDDVEARLDRRSEDTEVAAQELRAGLTGAARIDDQRADAVGRVQRRLARERDADRRVPGVRVVDGHREGRGLDPTAAGCPRKRCRIGRGLGGRRGRGGPSAGRGGATRPAGRDARPVARRDGDHQEERADHVRPSPRHRASVPVPHPVVAGPRRAVPAPGLVRCVEQARPGRPIGEQTGDDVDGARRHAYRPN